MEDPGEEWEIEQYYTSGEEVSQSKISKILSGGLWLGKKFVITGFVISSAPVVLPPLVVVSALGFAVSVPFGVVLASYTCAEKLMSKLLPMPQSSGMLDYVPLVMDQAEEDEEEFAMEEDEKAQIQDTEETVKLRIELVEDGNNKQQQENMMPVVDPDSERHVKPEGSLVEESKDEKPQSVVTRVVVAVPTEGKKESAAGKSEEAEVLKAESTGLLQKISDEGKSGESAKTNKKKNKDRLKKSLGNGGKKEDRSAKDTKEMEKNTKEENRNIEISVETTKDPVLDDREHAPVAEKPVESQNISINRKSSQGPAKSNTNHKKSTGNAVPYKPEEVKDSIEIFPSEKKLWEQINALRLVVGYKSNCLPSLTDELKALYVFTGVEPPSSFEDSTDIEDAEDKLRFLMSIVGVK